MATTPLIVAGLSLPPPLGERLPATAWIGIGVCLGGITLALLERSLNPIRQAQLRRGARDALLAAVFQALGLLLARWGLQEAGVGVAEGATIRMVFGTVGLVVLGLCIGRLGAWTQQLRGGGVWRRVAAASVIGTFLGIGTNQAGLAWARHAGVAATLNGLAPIFLIPLSAVFLAESHDWRAWLSTCLAVGGIALMTIA
jgi:drug/metabolite transporter (DMT)-like permease